jgi:hypothetical protein
MRFCADHRQTPIKPQIPQLGRKGRPCLTRAYNYDMLHDALWSKSVVQPISKVR